MAEKSWQRDRNKKKDSSLFGDDGLMAEDITGE
jgi:hypothetical protein